MKHFFLYLILTAQIAFSQVWKFGSQIRYRYEAVDKDFSDETSLNSFGAQRTRFNAKYTQDDLSLFIQIQDMRNYGSEISTLDDGSADNLDLHQGYITYSGFGSYTMKMGRFEQPFGNQRIMGAVGWHNIGRSFDGFVFSQKLGGHSIDYFTLNLNETYPDGLDEDDFYVNGANVVFAKEIPFLNETLFIQDGDRFTSHTSLKQPIGNVTLFSEVGYQFGKLTDETDVKAWMASVSAKLPLNSITLVGGADMVSGDDSSTDESESFNTLYATNHKFYGHMDYFLNLPVHTSSLGLVNLYGSLQFKLFSLNQKLTVHQFLSQQEDADGNSDFGLEVDYSLSKKLNDQFGLSLGYSMFQPGQLKSDTDEMAQWLYAMMTVTVK